MAKIRRIDYSPDEFLSGTLTLTDAECGLYWRCCTLIYSHGEPIPEDELRRCSGAHGNAFNKALGRLLELTKVLRLDDGRLTVRRCERELENAEKRSTNAQENVGKRWASRDKKQADLAENNWLAPAPVLPASNANHQPSTTTSPSGEDARQSARAVAEAMLEIWREELGEILGSPTKVAADRIKKCSARLRDDLGGDIENWRELCRRIGRSEFLTEKWKATIDWVLEPKNMRKVLEGNYDRERSTPLVKNAGNADAEQWRMRMSGFRKYGVWPAFCGPKPGEPGCWVPAEIIAEQPQAAIGGV